MPLFTIPIDNPTYCWEQTTELDGRMFGFKFAWNRRDESWYLDIRTAGGTLLAAGLKLTEGVNVLRRQASSEAPPGPLYVLDVSGRRREPTFSGLGTEFVMFYGVADTAVAS